SVVKHYTAKFFPIQLLIRRKNRTAKFASNFFFNLRIKIDKLVRGMISVEKFGTGNNFAQARAKCALARGNSAGDPDDSHLREDEKHGSLVAAPLSTSAAICPICSQITW